MTKLAFGWGAEKPSPALARTLVDHQGRLRAYIQSLLVDPHATDDVLQETNLVLCRKATDFTPGTNFKAWAFRIAYLEIQRHRRLAGQRRWVFDEDLLEKIEASTTAEDRLYELRRRTLRHCLGELVEQQRRLVLERYLLGRSVQEIASAAGRTANSVSLVLHRARQNLVDCVKRSSGGGRE